MSFRRHRRFGDKQQLLTPEELEVEQYIELIAVTPRDGLHVRVILAVLVFLGYARKPGDSRIRNAWRAFQAHGEKYTPHWRGYITHISPDHVTVISTHVPRAAFEYLEDPDDGTWEHMLQPGREQYSPSFDGMGLTRSGSHFVTLLVE